MDRYSMLEAPVETPPDRCFKQADNCSRWGEFMRGIRTMAAKPTAPANEANTRAMHDLHPTGGLPHAIPRDSDFPACRIKGTKKDATSVLHSFTRGSSGGISGWTPELMLQMARSPLEGYLGPLASLWERIAKGQVTGEHKRFLFSAKAIAHYKDEARTRIRPLAGGEVLRRGAGKLVLRNINHAAGRHLACHKQMAVGIKGGAESLIHSATAAVRTYRDHPDDYRAHVFLQTDRSNAFNMVSREKFLRACKEHVPAAYAYAVAAYEEATTVTFGETDISSESGCQQGCPLAMLLYSLAEADADAEIADELKNALFFRGAFADDNNMSGHIQAVHEFHERQKRIAPEYGFQFNPAKYTLACHPDLKDEALQAFGLNESCWVPFDELRVLGTPIGSEEVVARETGALVDKAVRSISRFELLPHAHRAATALWYGGKGLITHQLRTARLPLEVVDRLDKALLQSAANIYGVAPTDQVCARLSMAYKEGGWGYRPSAPNADIAYVASVSESKEYASQLTAADIRVLPVDCAIENIVSSVGSASQLASQLTGHRSGSAPTTMRGLQKQWSQMLNEATLTRRNEEAGITSRRDSLRIASCAGTWQTLHPLVTAD